MGGNPSMQTTQAFSEFFMTALTAAHADDLDSFRLVSFIRC